MFSKKANVSEILDDVLFSAGWGTKEAENVFLHTAGGPIEIGLCRLQ
jgi:hypothetical protein